MSQGKFWFQLKEPLVAGSEPRPIQSPDVTYLTCACFESCWIHTCCGSTRVLCFQGSILCCVQIECNRNCRNVVHGSFTHNALLSPWPYLQNHIKHVIMFTAFLTERVKSNVRPLEWALCDCAGCAPMKPTLLCQEAARQLEDSFMCCVWSWTPLTAQPELLPIMYLHKMVSLKLTECTDFKLSWINIVGAVGSFKGSQLHEEHLSWAFETQG